MQPADEIASRLPTEPGTEAKWLDIATFSEGYSAKSVLAQRI